MHLERVKASPKFQALELAMSSRSLPHWVNRWAMTYDPREPIPVQPFDLFPKQAQFLEWLTERERLQEDGLLEKSRDMGASWLCCAYALHGWLFRPGYQVGFGSRKLEYVDEKGDPKSIFEKLRLLLEYLPSWMVPAGFNWKEHSCHAKLINPANGATITGEGGDQLGRGARSSIYFVDEAAFLERPQLVDRALSQTTRCRIDVSTPNGDGNPFAQKRRGGRVPVFTLHWRDDPRKGEAWYENEKRRLDSVTLAQEVDIDYTASLEGIAIPGKWVRAAVGLDLSTGSGPVEAGLDIAEYGKDRCVFLTRQGPSVGAVEDWGQCNTTETAHRARELCVKHGVSTLHYDAGGPGAGVRGTLDSAESDLPFYADAVNAGSSPSGAWWPDGQTSAEKFLNLRAELWWLLRCRFEKTYEHAEGIASHPPEEMISIPDHPQLIAELSQPLCARTESGKIKIESKEAMRKRGVKSPDFADALALAFCDGGRPDFNIHHLKVSPEQPEDQSVAITLTKGFEGYIRHFPQSAGFQPLPVIDGEKVLSCPCFPKQSMAAYFVVKLCDDLRRPRPEGLPMAALTDEQREQVDRAVVQIIKDRKMQPAEAPKQEQPRQEQQTPKGQQHQQGRK